MKLASGLSKNHFRTLLLIFIVFSLGAGFGYSHFVKNPPGSLNTTQEKNTPPAFLTEAYDKINENYWDNLSETALIDLFKTQAERNGSKKLPAKIGNREKLISELISAQKELPEEQRVKFLPAVLSGVLSSLNPVGRSGLFTTKQEEQLKNTVENINPEKDLYKDLGLNKGASDQEVKKVYDEKSKELQKQNTPEAKEELKTLTYAKDVLTDKDRKTNYDSAGIEPTIFARVVSPGILYLQFKKFSPTSYEEFVKTFEGYTDNTSLYALIFDLRGNVGGAIDATAYFLGLFLGKNQYAFDFYHKGEYQPFKTPTDKLPSIARFKQVVILVDNQTQSSAEMMAASLKKYRVGVVVGVPTKGWGTVERVFQLDNQIDPGEKYSMFLVHSITLRDDNQPIEGRGVDPDINIENANWQQQLLLYFSSPNLLNAVLGVM